MTSQSMDDVRRNRLAATAIAAIACSATFLASAASAAPQQPTGADVAPPDDQTLLDFREVVRAAKDRVFPSVIYIKVVRKNLEGGKDSNQEISGSGVIISPGGEALTNWHVVDKAVSVRCLLSDGRPMDAKVIGSDKSTDLALIQLQLPKDVSNVPHAELGDSSTLREGDFVMAMGAPWGLNRSVTIGIVSCTRRYLPETSEYSTWLQTDAAISPGNSGGPLVNTEGKVVGLNTRGMMQGGDMGFTVPSEVIDILLPQFREHGESVWTWSGLQLQALRDFNRNMYFEGTKGVIVAETDPESPARRAGLVPRDRIMKVNGEPITALTEEDLPAVRRRMALLPTNQPCTLDVRRGGEMLTVQLEPRLKGKVEGEELDCKRWDFTVKAINQFDNEDLYFHRKEGVFVYGVKWPGNAGDAGLQEKDIILKIDGKEVVTLEDVKSVHADAMKNLGKKHKVVVVVLRGGLMRQIVLDFARDHEKR
jgi:serine protease Do